MLTELQTGTECYRFGASFDRLPYFNDNGVEFYSQGWYTDTIHGPPEDTLGALIAKMEFLSKPIDPSSMFGFDRTLQDANGEVNWTGYKPIASDRGASMGSLQRAAILQNAMALFTGRADDPNAFASDFHNVPGENPVSHTNLHGRVTRDIPDDHWYRQPYDEGIHEEYDVPTWQRPKCKMKFYYDSAGLLRTLRDVYSSFISEWMRAVRYPVGYGTHNRDALIEKGSSQSDGFSAGNTGKKFSNWRATWSAGGLLSHCSYSMERHVKLYSGRSHAKWNMTISLCWDYLPNHAYALGQWIDIGKHVQLKCNYTAVCEFHRIYDDYDELVATEDRDPVNWDYTREGYISHVSISEHQSEPTGVEKLLSYNPPTDEFGWEDYNLVRIWDRQMAHNAPRLFPGAVKAANEALTSAISALEANHLENLTQLDSFRDFISPVINFVQLAKAVRTMKPVDVVLEIGDLLTDAQLLYSYGIAPTIGDAEEISSQASTTFDAFKSRSIYEMKTHFGTFDFDIPDDFHPHFRGLRAVYNAKVVMGLNPNSILASFMPLRAFGLFPTLSNMWDLIPFSFIADWFTGIGDKLDDADSAITFLGFDIQKITMSMKLYWTVSADLLDRSCLRSDGQAPHLTYYVRTATNTIPGVVYSDVDFDPGSGFPDWKTVSSLAWKFVRR